MPTLEDYIRNELLKLCSDEEIKLNRYSALKGETDARHRTCPRWHDIAAE